MIVSPILLTLHIYGTIADFEICVIGINIRWKLRLSSMDSLFSEKYGIDSKKAITTLTYNLFVEESKYL